MKDSSRDIAAKYRRQFGPGAAYSGTGSDLEVLRQSDDPGWYIALSPERINAVEFFPWQGTMDVLLIGACSGCFSRLLAAVRSFDILDDDESRRELARYRSPAPGPGFICGGESGRKGSYDVCILSLADTPAADPLEAARSAAAYLKPSGSLILTAANSDALRYLTGAMPPGEGTSVGMGFPERLRDELSFAYLKKYYPLPDQIFAKQIFSDDMMPSADAFRGISENPYETRYIFCNEERLYARLSGTDALAGLMPAFVLVLTCDRSIFEALPSYIKYNRMRDPAFAVRTEIFSKEGSPYGRAVKTALTDEADRHIEAFAERAEILEKEAGGRFGVLRAAIGKNAFGRSFASFPLLEGTDLGRKLAQDITDGLAPHAEIEAAMEVLLGTGDQPLHNLDALFENLIAGPDGSLTLIDYEWVTDEPLERDFLRYRMLRYWYEAYSGLLTGYSGLDEFLEGFGLGPESTALYAARELLFQEKARGGMKSLEEQFLKPQEYVYDIQARLKVIEEQKEEIRGLKEALSRERETERLSQNHIRNIEAINTLRQSQLESLSERNAWLEKHRSLSSRAVGRCISLLDAWAPAGSRRRALIHIMKRTLRSPLRMLSKLASGEGRVLISGELEIGGEFAEGGILELPEAGTAPLVSIVIPVYNEVAYTYSCVRSIIAHTDFAETPYEVLLADDVSSDATAHISRYIRGLIICRNAVNTGFLKNCNQAAKKAGGKYIFFLNNDTRVHPGWLSALVRLMESDSSIGLSGSKLVYPDGRLQEAGGIIWRDASGWNYGRLDDPDRPEYNYVKDVDYISGAAIMIRRSLWEEIGGFDERFAPAYCEDSDLAFEVRRHGKRVVYQPASVVTHFEGISNGTDTGGTGLKRYQVINAQKFREKWADELKSQQVNTGSPDPFTARDRSAAKRCIVVIDHYVPTWDRDAGSRTTYQYLRMFVKKGFNVKFIGDNFRHDEPYTSELEQLGIEVLYGAWMQDNIFEWFRKNRDHIDICYLNRPHIASKYIDFLKNETDIRCIFYGHDLHYLRIWREYELTGDMAKLRESEYWKSIELSVMRQADMIYYPSAVEEAEIKAAHPELPVRAVTAYLWDEFRDIPQSAGDFAARKDLLFVGGFKHPPNADGVKWFAERIFPIIRRALPGVRFLVAGSGADGEIKALASEESGIEVLGFVSDERLSGLYAETRITVVPLRYGAGVKGKVIEAAYNGACIVTTSVGAEGIPDAESIMAIADRDPRMIYERPSEAEAAFAEAVISLYNDPGSCARMSRSCTSYIREHNSLEAAWKVIEEDFRA